MNKSNLKSYAPQARKDSIAAVIARALQLGSLVKENEQRARKSTQIALNILK
jgi:hypothetical protein